MDSQLTNINIGLDEYMDVVNQIEEIDKKVSSEKRVINITEAKKEIRLLIQLLEFNNSRVSTEKIEKNEIHNVSVKKYTPFGKYYFATTKNGKYECVIVDDTPSMFLIASVEGSRQIKSAGFIGGVYKHSLHIQLDKRWYENLMNHLAEELRKDN